MTNQYYSKMIRIKPLLWLSTFVQGKEDKNILEDRKPELRKLQIESAVKMGDNFELNRALRAGLRYAKKLDEGPLDDERTFAKGNNI